MNANELMSRSAVGPRRVVVLGIAILSILAAFSCSSGQKPAESGEKQAAAPAAATKQEPQENEYLTGRAAFQKLFVSARAFAPDVKPYRLQSSYTPNAPVNEGKSALWRGQFASPSKASVKAYSWSGLTGPDAPDRGVSHSTEDTYNPNNASTAVFDLPRLKIDTDQAFQVALKHGGSKIYEKDPKQPVVYTLDFDPKATQLVWHVAFGDDPNNAKLRIAVDASTGEYIRKER